jgi:hypothetical protein
MGCGASTSVDVAEHQQKPQPRPTVVTPNRVEVKPIGTHRQPLEPIKSTYSNQSTKKEDVPSYTAFEIKLNEKDTRNLNANIDSLLSRPIAGKNTTLAPIAPRAVPTNVECEDPEIERKRKLKQKQLSRRRTELMSARRRAQATTDYDNYDEDTDIREDPAVVAEMLESKMVNAERMREIRLQEIQEKQRLREERGRLARERAQQMKRNGELDGEDIETNELGRRSTMTRRDDDDYGSHAHHNRSETPPTPTPNNIISNNRRLPPVQSKMKSPRDVSPDSSSGYNSREVSAGSQANATSVDIRGGMHHGPHGGDHRDDFHSKSHHHKSQHREWDDDDERYVERGIRVEGGQRYDEEEEFY